MAEQIDADTVLAQGKAAAASLVQLATPRVAAPSVLAEGVGTGTGDSGLTMKDQPLTGLQTAAVSITLLVIAIVAAISFFLLADGLQNGPSLPQLPTDLTAQATATAASAAALVQNYKDLSEAHRLYDQGIWDELVAKGWLPVLTGLLGFLFGTRFAGGSDTTKPQ